MTSLRYSLVGIAGGLAAAFGISRLLTTFLFGVTPWDPLAFTLAVAMLTTVATVAAWIPARRAARIDPIVALRTE